MTEIDSDPVALKKSTHPLAQRPLIASVTVCSALLIGAIAMARSGATKVAEEQEDVAEPLVLGPADQAAEEVIRGMQQEETPLYEQPLEGPALEVVEAPRQVLRAFGNGNGNGLVEMESSGQDALCCGTSGFIHCDANSRRLQSERLASAEATGADTLATACPKCLIHFGCAQSEDRRRGRHTADIAIEDLTVLAAAALTRAEPTAIDAEQKNTGEA